MTSLKNALLEIGTEHLPARFVRPALEQLKTLAETLLAQKRLTCESVETFGTYRRLVVFIHGLAEKSADIQKEVKGPPAKLLKDAQGNFTPQSAGFAQKNGITPEKLTVRETDKGPFIFADVKISGEKTAKLLPEIFTLLVTKLEFAKNMVWEDTGLRYGRPIRSLLGLYGDKVVKFTVAGVTSGRYTHGLLSYGNKPLKVERADKKAYITLLKNQNPPILVWPEERRQALIQSVTSEATARGCKADLDENLIQETICFTEHPVAVCGDMDLKALTLPKLLITTVLKEQLKMFPVLDKKDQLQPYFIAVRDGSSVNQNEVRDGFRKVMSARLSDAVFFFENDKKAGLKAFHQKLQNIQFLEGVGTLADKALRTQKLAAKLGEKLGISQTEGVAYAALHVYDDLASQVVYEFPELQGYMGGQYAALEAAKPGAPCWMKAAAKAMEEGYWPLTSTSALPTTQMGNIVSLASKLDTLAGNFLIGQIPTGSEDPFALRRQAFAVVRILLENRYNITVQQLLEAVYETYQNRLTPQRQTQLADFLYQRLEGILQERGYHPGLLKAVDRWKKLPLGQIEHLVSALQTVQNSQAFTSVRESAKRVGNILKKSEAGSSSVNPELLELPAEKSLYQTAQLFTSASAHTKEDYIAALKSLEKFKAPLEQFFTDVMVNVPDEKLRQNRLALLALVREKLAQTADITAL